MFGRKKKKTNAEPTPAPAPATVQGARPVPTEEEYRNYIKSAKERIELSLVDYAKLADELRLAAKKISRVKGIFGSNISRGKQKKHGGDLKCYNSALDAFITASSEINWLIESVESCYEGLARVMSSPRAASKVRIEGEKYSADVTFKKAKLDRKLDGVVMPISNYIK